MIPSPFFTCVRKKSIIIKSLLFLSKIAAILILLLNLWLSVYYRIKTLRKIILGRANNLLVLPLLVIKILVLRSFKSIRLR